MRQGGGQQAQRCHQHGHHDGAKSQHGAFDGCLHDVFALTLRCSLAARPQLIDEFDHDHAGLHRHAEEGEKADSGRDREVGVREKQRQRPADGSHDHGDQNQHRPLEGAEHGVKNEEDRQAR